MKIERDYEVTMTEYLNKKTCFFIAYWDLRRHSTRHTNLRLLILIFQRFKTNFSVLNVAFRHLIKTNKQKKNIQENTRLKDNDRVIYVCAMYQAYCSLFCWHNWNNKNLLYYKIKSKKKQKTKTNKKHNEIIAHRMKKRPCVFHGSHKIPNRATRYTAIRPHVLRAKSSNHIAVSDRQNFVVGTNSNWKLLAKNFSVIWILS